MTARKPRKSVWILMYQCDDGRWEPSMSESAAWNSKRGIQWKLKQLAKAGQTRYAAFEYQRIEEPR